MKQLPRILPRSSLPDKAQLAVRSSPPSLAPKDASGVGGASGPGGPAAAAAASGGGVKVIAMATLPQRRGAPVPVMILPQGCLSYDREKVPPPQQAPPPQHAPSAPTSVVQKARGGTSKRPLEVVTVGGALGVATASASPVKRKRGRPRKPRKEDALPPPPVPPPAAPAGPAPPSQPSIITSLTGGVIQKASSSSSSSSSSASSSSSSQPVLELVIQEQPGLILSGLPAVSDPAQRLVEQPLGRGVVVQCQAGAGGEADHHSRPLLLLQTPPNPSWELSAAAGRTPMVEVIQKAPRPSNNSGAPPPTAHFQPPLPLPTVHEDQAQVEITLTPVDLPITPPLLPASSSSPATALLPSSTAAGGSEEEEGGSSGTSSNRGGH